MFKILSTYTCWKQYIKCNIWRVVVRPSYIWEAGFLKVNVNWNIATKLSKAFLYDATQYFFWLFSSSYVWTDAETTERQVEKQSITNMYFTANIHTTVHNVKLPVTQQLFNTLQNATHRINFKFHLYQQVKSWLDKFVQKKKVSFL